MRHQPRWITAPKRPQQPDERGKRLVIVIPFRDRQENLAELLPALSAYMLRNDAPRLAPLPRICIVEQADDDAFNKGALCNVGFALHRNELDYVCFHDVDCVPLEADYSYADLPTRVLEVGTRNPENLDVYFGGVVALSRADFETINGFSNHYRRWGFEDNDLLLRIVRNGMALEARPGVFRALSHVAAERDEHGAVRAEVYANRDRFRRRFDSDIDFWTDDGLRTLRYTLMATTQRADAGKGAIEIVHHRVNVPASFP